MCIKMSDAELLQSAGLVGEDLEARKRKEPTAARRENSSTGGS
jgi:hypothetical protein